MTQNQGLRVTSSGDLISMSKITHDLLEFPIESIFTHPTRTGPRHAYKFNQKRCFTQRSQQAFSVPLWNKLPAKLVSETFHDTSFPCLPQWKMPNKLVESLRSNEPEGRFRMLSLDSSPRRITKRH